VFQQSASLFFLRPIAPPIEAAKAVAQGEHEGITVVERSLDGLAFDADQGRIADAKLLTLVLALRLRRPELFGPLDRANSWGADRTGR
jgi:hypothetical protein